MTQASYNDIAQWYDQFLRERPVYVKSQLEWPIPKRSEPACYGRHKRWDHSHVLELARGDARGEIRSTNRRGKRSGQGMGSRTHLLL
jgi:hypothetical protein